MPGDPNRVKYIAENFLENIKLVNTVRGGLTAASTLTLQNVNIGYTLPKRIVSKIGLSGVRVYASGENLFYLSKRKGFDPRGSFWGSSSESSYSQVRTFTGGLTVTF